MKLPHRFMAAALLAGTIVPLYSQVGPAADEGGVPFVVGAGFSSYNTDWGSGRRMEGIAAWADFYPPFLPRVLHGLGIEAEGRDINFGRPSSLSNMRQDTGMGGVIYSWDHYRNFRPYARFLAGIGSIDFPRSVGPAGPYSHDTFVVTAPAGGVEYRAWRHMWIRGGYEYQIWHNMFNRPETLNPNGVTIGLSYDFRRLRSH